MTRSQRLAVSIGAAAIAIMGLFPPWEYTFATPMGGASSNPAGYAFILKPPAPQEDTPLNGVRVDFARFGVQAVATGVLTIGGVFSLGLRKSPP